MPGTVPAPGGGWRRRFTSADLILALGVVALLWVVVHIDQGLGTPSAHLTSTISLAPSHLPYYAARSLLRMFIAYALSVVFTFAYGTAAARSRRWRAVLIPFLDILQSVPVLGFLSITVTFFVGLFPGSSLGLECASVFAIFTAMAWNMTFSFYHSLITQPAELDEATRMFRLTKWERFWRLDVPSSMIGQVWNGMMSFGGAWFFLAASEAITVNGHSKALPGIGSYMQVAETDKDTTALIYAIVTMVVMIVVVNWVFWRPMVAWGERFRIETSEAEEAPRSGMLSLIRHSHAGPVLHRLFAPVALSLDSATRPFGLAERPLRVDERRQRTGDVAYGVIFCALVGLGVWRAAAYFADQRVLGQFPHAFLLGLYTFGRVTVLVVVCSLIWVPVGAIIGMSPRLTRYAQPVVQVLASFPALFLFPFAIMIFDKLGISLDVGGIALMALGTQWYILFNCIAGGSAIPTDLREMAADFRLPMRQKWRRLILPGIFPYYVTGGITAAGGAWNASIVAEYVKYGKTPLVAHGLGAYITEASVHGDRAEVLVGILVMSFFVVTVNVLFWGRLYRLAESRYSLASV